LPDRHRTARRQVAAPTRAQGDAARQTFVLAFDTPELKKALSKYLRDVCTPPELVLAARYDSNSMTAADQTRLGVVKQDYTKWANETMRSQHDKGSRVARQAMTSAINAGKGGGGGGSAEDTLAHSIAILGASLTTGELETLQTRINRLAKTMDYLSDDSAAEQLQQPLEATQLMVLAKWFLQQHSSLDRTSLGFERADTDEQLFIKLKACVHAQQQTTGEFAGLFS